MSNQGAEICEWDRGCANTATLHARWLLNNGDAREKHLCEAHAAELRETTPEVQDRPLSSCGASCQIVLRNARVR